MATRRLNLQERREMKVKAEALLPLFNNEFPDEQTTLQRIFIESGVKECECGATLNPDFKSRSFECRKCGEDTWLTATTGFRNVRQLRVYVAAAWFQGRGIELSGPLLAFLTGAPGPTCQRAAKRPGVTLIYLAQEETKQVLVPTAEFCPIYARRSTETPEKKHPVAEQEAMERRCRESSNKSGQQFSPEPGPESSQEQKTDKLETSEIEQTSDAPGEPLCTVHSHQEAAAEHCTAPENNAPVAKSSDELKPQSSDKSVPCESVLRQEVLALLANSERPLNFEEILNKIGSSLFSPITTAVMNLWFSGRLIRLFGDNWKLAPTNVIPEQLKCSDFIRTVLDEFCYKVKLFKGGVSRKHVQIHLALYCFQKVRKLLTEDWLFKSMCAPRPPSFEVPDVSPLLINMFGFLNLDQTSLVALPTLISKSASAANLDVAPT